jgi:anti-sigma B factor antagonist
MAELDNNSSTTILIDVELDPTGAQVVVLSGELDSSNVAQLEAKVASITAESSRPLIFDLTGLQFMDSAGIAALIGAATKTSVSLRNPSPVIRRVLKATGLSGVLAIEP